MADAVRRAYREAEPGDMVLLAPACASFDMFTSFEHRGRVFKEEVRSIQHSAVSGQPEEAALNAKS
jgi:UDP-N-acetylmuramoylalanine--D-glutamate ligase